MIPDSICHIFRPPGGYGALRELMTRLDLELVERVEGRPGDPDAFAETYAMEFAGGEIVVTYAEDGFLPFPYVRVTGGAVGLMMMSDIIAAELPVYSRADQLAAWDAAPEDPDDRMDAVLRLAAAPDHRDLDASVTRVLAALRDPDEAVRDAAVAAVAWLPEPPLLDAVTALRDGDPSEQVRLRARIVTDLSPRQA